jgi:hypothetical protein
MDNIGLDLHKRESQLCILTDEGEILERRIHTSRERFTAVLGARPPARLLLEASTESEWVARHLETLGHEVIVADPNFAPMYAPGAAGSRPTGGTRARWPRPAGSGRIAAPIGRRTDNGMSAPSSRCATR